MGKNPAFLFYPSDWVRDMQGQPLEIKGAWIDILCRLWWENPRGRAVFSLQKWAIIIGCSAKKAETIIKYLLSNKIADGEFLDNQNITIISRRMMRDEEIRQKRREVGKLGGNPAFQ